MGMTSPAVRPGKLIMKVLTTLLFLGQALFAAMLLLVAIMAWPPQMGLDFTGGVRLVYEADVDALEDDGQVGHDLVAIQFQMSYLVQALTDRINPGGTREAVVRRNGEWEVEIFVPKADAREMERLKKLICTAGKLEFRIVANRDRARHGHVIALAEEQSKDAERQRSNYVKDADAVVGRWARVDRVDPMREAVASGVGPFRAQVAGDVIRNANTGELIQLPASFNGKREYALEQYLIEQGIDEIDVLLIVDQDLTLTGEHLGVVGRGYDQTMRPMVRFTVKGQGIGLMAALTGGNLPDLQRTSYQRLAILLDGRVLSAPRIMSTISDRGQITGDFTVEEVDFIVSVLQAGTLPVLLKDEPILETVFSPEETARQTAQAIAWIALGMFVLIWLLTSLRYRVMGLGTSMASLLQLLSMLVVIELVRVPVTMPLIHASTTILLLTLGGNLLICESVHRRIRDEQSSPVSIWQGFLRAAVPFAILLVALMLAALVTYFVGDFPIRITAVPVVIGSMAGLAASCLCLLLPVALIATRFQTAAVSKADSVPQ